MVHLIALRTAPVETCTCSGLRSGVVPLAACIPEINRAWFVRLQCCKMSDHSENIWFESRWKLTFTRINDIVPCNEGIFSLTTSQAFFLFHSLCSAVHVHALSLANTHTHSEWNWSGLYDQFSPHLPQTISVYNFDDMMQRNYPFILKKKKKKKKNIVKVNGQKSTQVVFS